MTRRAPAPRPRAPEDLWRRAALLGLSFTLIFTTHAQAGDILRGGAPAGTRGAPTAFGTNPAVTAQARKNAQDVLARTTQAIQSVQAMQAAARAAAIAGPNNLGPDLNHPGQPLPNVPNGLGTGGLQVAPGVPANLAAPQPGENSALWTGANLPTQTTASGRTTVNIKQTAAQALLNWKTFNIGKQTTVNFDQSAGGADVGKWIAFNKINDPSGSPTQILGAIKADGQVYVINQNGIIFGGSSQVNAHALVASSLPINDNLVSRGLLNNPDAQFLFSSLPINAGSKGTPAFTPAAALTPSGQSGDVQVQKGATLTSPTTPDHVGGRVTLVGPNVTNDGTMETPDGQTVLAAGLQVGFAAHASSDPSLRGLDVSVGAATASSGAATNSGLISAPRASVIMTGKTVNQLGVINSSTSVALNGRVDLLADYNASSNPAYDPVKSPSIAPFFFKSSGTITLGPSSVIQILPDASTIQTIASTVLPLTSQISLQGQIIHLQRNTTILAPDASISLQAGLWDSAGGAQSTFVFTSATTPAINPQIFLDPGATINVAGSTDIPVPIGRNILDVEVRGSELADAPLQRKGPIRGTTLHVDLRIHGPWDPTLNGGAGDYSWVGTPLADARGYRDLIQRSVGELTTAGGSVNLQAGGSVVLQKGSTIDVSGGWISYQGGTVQTSRLMSGGQLIDIAQATPDRVYQGAYTGTFTESFAKYGISQVFTHPLALTGAHFEQGYVSGAAGGSISLTAPVMVLDGTLLGQTAAGPRQRNTAPVPSSLSLTFQQQDTSPQHYAFSPTPPSIVFENGISLAPAAPFALDVAGSPLPLPVDRQKRVVLSPYLLTSSGFGNLTVNNGDGDISVPAGVALTAAASGSITLFAANLAIDGQVSAPGGKLNFVAYNFTPYLQHLFPTIPPTSSPPANQDRGLFTLGAGAALNATGLIVDDLPSAPGRGTLPMVIDAGSIAISAYDTNLAPASTIDVSGGIFVTGTGKRTFGKAGSIDIKAGADPNINSITGGRLLLKSTLRGFSGIQGGSGTLGIQAPLVQIGGAAPKTDMVNVGGKNVPMLNFNGTLVEPGEFLLLPPDFFNQGGFQNFIVKGLGAAATGTADLTDYLPGVSIAPGTIIAPRAQNFIPSLFGSTTGHVELRPMLLPEAHRSPVSLTLSAVGISDSFSGGLVARGDFLMGAGASIQTDPFPDSTRGVTISGQTATILGSITSPGGLIQIAGSDSAKSFLDNSRAVASVYLSSNAVLSAAGKSQIERDARGFRIGTVLGGGRITVTGNIVAESGALLDVSGASGILDLSPQWSGWVPRTLPGNINPLNASLRGQPRIATRLDSNAGAIVLKGGLLLFSDAALRGTSGGTAAQGGSLQISSGIWVDPNFPQTPLDVTLTVTQDGHVIPSSFDAHQGAVVGRPVIDIPGAASSGGYISVGSFARGGFDFINLRGTVRFSGATSLSAGREMRVGDGGVIMADNATRLTAPYVALGTVFQPPQTFLEAKNQLSIFTTGGQPFFFPPTSGNGSLTVEASLIDVGNISMQGISKVLLNADHGEIRGNGTLDIAGGITLRAAQIYPPSAIPFTVAAYDPNVMVASSSKGSRTVTLASPVLPPGFGVGSPLLGSEVVGIDGVAVSLQSGANATIGTNTPVTFAPGSGSVTIVGSGSRQLPLSAGGTFNIYGSIIRQGGKVLAPGGTINLGWDGTGSSPADYISGAGLPFQGGLQARAVAATQQIQLQAGSFTSVSLIDSTTGKALLVPYGLTRNSTQWIDPLGNDITAGGVAGKSITISAIGVIQQAGAVVDIRGGGDLYSYTWIPGVGGSKDVLASTTSFAVIPGYDVPYAPYAPFADSSNFTYANPTTGTTVTDPGYVIALLRVGDRVHLGAVGNFAAGDYTLLPARYALLPGAFLVTPQSGMPVGSFILPEGAGIVSGYRFNSLSAAQTAPPLTARFEVAPQSVVRARSQYDDSTANAFLSSGALSNNAPVPRLPADAGYLQIEASQALVLQGMVFARGASGFHGGLVDLSIEPDASAPGGVMIAGGTGSAGFNGILLDAAKLSSFGADSLLVGGVRHFGSGATTITVTTNDLTVDNAGTPLTGPEIVLVANKNLTLAPGAEIAQSGKLVGAADALLLGDPAKSGSGNGLILRLSSDPAAGVARSGVTISQVATLRVGAGAKISGTSILLDSSNATLLDPDARILGRYLSLNSGRITLQLDPAATIPAVDNLVLAGTALNGVENSNSLSLLSYGSLDIYGSGDFTTSGSLALHAASIRGFKTGGGVARFTASAVTMDNVAGGAVPLAGGALLGTLQFDAQSVNLGSGALNIDQYQTLGITATHGLRVTGTGGLRMSGDLQGVTPEITSAQGASYTIDVTGAMNFDRAAGSGAATSSGLGATLKLLGSRVMVTSDVLLPSGSLTLQARGAAATDGVTVGGRLDTGGTAQGFYDVTKYTSGGEIRLISSSGDVVVEPDAVVNVSAEAGGGNAGDISVSVPGGQFLLHGSLLGQAGAGGVAGTFSLDVGRFDDPAALASTLKTGGFVETNTFRVRMGDVAIASTFQAHNFYLSADGGSIFVGSGGKIDASGGTGGTINLSASGSVVLRDGSVLTVEGGDFNNAGKGGAISLEAGAEINGVAPSTNTARDLTGRFGTGVAVVDIQSGATINLGVKSTYSTGGGVDPADLLAAANLGKLTGTLHLRAPQTSNGSDLQINPILGNILGAPSSILAEGYQVFLAADGSIDNQEANLQNNGTVFAGNSATIATRLLGATNPLASIMVVLPGAEIVNPGGDLTLANDWDLSSFRFGPTSAPGVLTLRASGNLIFSGALSDGFDGTAAANSGLALYQAALLTYNPVLPANVQSWSYRLTAGADFSAADFRRVRPLEKLPSSSGSLELGQYYSTLELGPDGYTADALLGHYQVIRTGSGDIEISAGRDVQLRNPFATIYTAGTQVADSTTVVKTGDFDVPIPLVFEGEQGALGSVQNQWNPQYSRAGGDLTIAAQGNIQHQTVNFAGKVVADSERQIPTNWLYRRSYVGSDGFFGTGDYGDITSTTWWIDFSNFFEGVGTLGGGNLTMTAGGNISNVDAVIPTNARMVGKDATTGLALAANTAPFLELGGGSLTVRAGANIDGGIYYVESGQGALDAGGSIVTNATRAPSLSVITSAVPTPAPQSWLPTVLFLGKGSFDVSAGGDVTLGPTINAFMAPPGLSNSFRYKTYFSTYAPDSAVSVASLGGTIDLRETSTLPIPQQVKQGSVIQVWMDNVSRLTRSGVSFYEPWIRLSETSVVPFNIALSLNPAAFRATAFSGDINIAGNLTLAPSPSGTLDLLAAGAVNGLRPIGLGRIANSQITVWDSSQIIVSDANPSAIPGITTSFAAQGLPSDFGPEVTNGAALAPLSAVFAESGSLLGTQAVIQTKLALHDPALLHATDTEPLRIYSKEGNIADFTLYSPKSSRILAGNDLSDIGLYVQNVSSEDFSVVAAGRDITAYDPNSPLLLAAQQTGNITVSAANKRNPAQSGDIQITGPGTLEVLAGRNLDLGAGRNANLAPDLGVGISSLGDARNPALPANGAQIFVGAGVGGPAGLSGGTLDLQGFIGKTLTPEILALYLPELDTGDTPLNAAGFGALSKEKQASLALDIFYRILRDAGRDHNDPASPDFGTYTKGFAAIAALFGSGKAFGDIALSSRSLKTTFGGDINLFAPAGGLSLGFDIPGAGQVPPGIITEAGGNISIFTDKSVQVGALRIFTLRGGNEIIWSSKGDIAAGTASKTVKTAPPTRVVIDVQSADVSTDLAGLATGGGIGVLASVAGVKPGDVDLIAPNGTIDAGDAGIRATGNLNVAAVAILNADNIKVGGSSIGTPPPAVSSPVSLSIAAPQNTNPTTNPGEEAAKQAQKRAVEQQQEDQPSLITVEVLGYGGGGGSETEQ